MLHRIKIKWPYLAHILEGKKTFEVRINDRDYQVGDELEFDPIDDDRYPVVQVVPVFEVVYVHCGYGVAPGFVVLGIQQKQIATKG